MKTFLRFIVIACITITVAAVQNAKAQTILYTNNIISAADVSTWTLGDGVSYVNSDPGGYYGVSGGALRFASEGATATTPAIIPAGKIGPLTLTISAIYSNSLTLYTSPDGITFTSQGSCNSEYDPNIVTVNKSLPGGTRYLKFESTTPYVSIYLLSMEISGNIVDQPLEKTLELTEAGTLSNLLSDIKNTVTKLTLSGSIDSRDFRFMRDEMPVLLELDLSGANIVAYTGTEGTLNNYNGEGYNQSAIYQNNVVPQYAFSRYVNSAYAGHSALLSVVMPGSATEVAFNAFVSCPSLSSVTLNEGLKIIGQQAFYNVYNLRTIDIPSTLTSIGSMAFYECISLEGSLTLPAGLTTIGSWAFAYTKITSLSLPSGLTSVGEYAFMNCTSLKGSLVIPSSLAGLGASAFNSTGFDGTLSFENGITALTAIPSGVFMGCKFTGNLVIPEGITSIGDYAFEDVSISDLSLPASLKSIGNSAFTGCDDSDCNPYNLQTVTSLSSIPPALGTDVFYIDNKPQTLRVPFSALAAYQGSDWSQYFNEIVSGGYSFAVSAGNPLTGSISSSQATGLIEAGTTITLTATPQTGYNFTGWYNANRLNGIGEPLDAPLHTAAAWTIKLTQDTSVVAIFDNSITTAAEAGKLKDIAGVATATHLTLTGTIDARDFRFMRDNIPALAALDLSGVSVAAYTGSEGTLNGEQAYPTNTIPAGALTEKMSLHTLKLPVRLVAIGRESFNNCSNLVGKLDIPVGVETIDISAFYRCKFSEVNFPLTLSYIGISAFRENNISNAITIPGNVGAFAFYQNKQLKDVTFTAAGGNSAAIGDYAFNGCDLQNLSLPEGVVSIGAEAFIGNLNMESATLPSSLQQIGSRAFSMSYNNTKMKEVYSLNRNPQDIAEKAFEYFGGSLDSYSGNNIYNNVKLYVPTGTASTYQTKIGWYDIQKYADILADAGHGFYYANTFGGSNWTNNINDGGYAFAAGATEGKVSSTKPDGLYPAGTSITLTAEPLIADAGYVFDGWFLKGQTEPVSTDENYVLTMPESDQILTARYTLKMDENVQPNGVKDIPQVIRATSLTLKGTIDARDFRFIRDNLSKLVSLDLGGVSVVAYTGSEGTLTGEQTYPANEVPAYAFYKTASGLGMTFSELVLPAATASIGEYALYNCSNVAGKLGIPAKLGAYALSGMSGLSGVEFNNNVSAGGYLGTYSLQNIALPAAFTLPASVESIGAYAFAGTAIDSIILPSVKTVENNAFVKTSLRKITMPVLETVGDSAFIGTSLIGSLYLNQSLKSIGAYAFEGLGIEALYLPDTMESIGAYAFANNADLDFSMRGDVSGLHIPEEIDTLAEGVFTGCAFIVGLKLPESLRCIVSSSEVPAFKGSNFSGDLDLKNCAEIGEDAFAQAGFLGGRLTLAEGMTEIRAGVFSQCNFVGTLELYEGIKTVGDFAFDGNGFDTLILPASLDSIGVHSFYDCISLRSIINLSAVPQNIAKDQNSGTYGDGWFGWSGEWTAPEDLRQYPYYLNESLPFGGIPKQFKYSESDPANICILTVPTGSVAAYQDAPAWGYWTMKYVEPLSSTHDYQVAMDAFDSIAGGGHYLSYRVSNEAFGSIETAAKNHYLHDGELSFTAVAASGLSFKNWTDANGNVLGTSSTLTLTINRDTVIIANFVEPAKVTVSFETNGGNAIADKDYWADGFKYGLTPNTGLPVPTREGKFSFDGWYFDDLLTQAVTDSSVVLSTNHTLYAGWTDLSVGTEIDLEQSKKLKLYPNPTSSIVYIDGVDAVEIYVYNSSGVLVQRTFGKRVDLSKHPAGIYLLRANGKTVRVVKK